MNQETPKIAVTEPEIKLELTVFTSLLPAMAGAAARHVSRQPSNPRGRKGTPQGPRGIQASDRREVRNAILHHQPGRKGCSSISLRGMAADRTKAGLTLEFQPDQEEALEPHQLLRAARGNGRTGKTADSLVAARLGGDQGRSGGGRQSDVSGSAEHRALSKGYSRQPVHG